MFEYFFSIFLRFYCEMEIWYEYMKVQKKCSRDNQQIQNLKIISKTFHRLSEEMLNTKVFFILNLGVILLNVRHGFVYGLTWVSHIKIMLFIRVIIQSLFVFTSSRRMWSKYPMKRDAIESLINPVSRSTGTAREYRSATINVRKENNGASERFYPQAIINIYDFQHINFHILICKLSSWINGHNLMRA